MYQITSDTIKIVRPLLAFLTILVHSCTHPEELIIDWNALSGMDGYNMIRLFCSFILGNFAVPCFFIISGYLFFVKGIVHDLGWYKKKWQNRFWSLFIPYLAWNVIYIIYNAAMIKCGVISGTRPAAEWNDFISSIQTPNVFWMFREWGGGLPTLLGQLSPSATGPFHSILWFIRDLVLIVIFSPLLEWLIKKSRGVLVLVFAFCFLFKVNAGFYFPFKVLFFFSVGAWFGLRKIDFAELFRKSLPVSIPVTLIMMGIDLYLGANLSADGAFFHGFVLLICPVGVFGLAAIHVRKKSVSAVASSDSSARHPSVEMKKKTLWDRMYAYASTNTYYMYLSHAVFGLPVVSFLSHRLLSSIPQTPMTLTVGYLVTPFAATASCLAFLYLFELAAPRFSCFINGKQR